MTSVLTDSSAPAIPAISYEDVVTTSGFGRDISPYMGKPTPEKDELWRDLYNCKIVVLEYTPQPVLSPC